jgi:glutamate transport system permease protein
MTAQSVLFDAPGPKARRRHLLLAVLGGAVTLGFIALIIRGLANPANNQLTGAKWQPFLTAEAWSAYFLPGIWATIKAAGLAVAISSVLGILLGMGRLSQLTPLRVLCGVFVEFFRAVPVLMMMLFFYFFGLYALGISGPALSLFGVVAGLTFYNASVIAELIRSGVNSLPRGQREAGWAIGMTPTQTLVTILLPQAITAMLPSLVSQLVVILKDTALGYIISYPELIRAGQNFSSNKGNLIPTFIVLAAMFVVINYALTRLARVLERRLQVSGRGGKIPPADLMLNPEMAPAAAPETAAVNRA